MTIRQDIPQQMRIFELANHLDVPAAELLARVNHLDIEAQSVLKAIDRRQMRRILEDYRDRTNGSSTPPDRAVLDELLASLNGAIAADDDPLAGREPGNQEKPRPRTTGRIVGVGVVIVLMTMLATTLYAVMRPIYAAESDIVITISGLGSEEIQRELESFNVVADSQTVLAPVAEDFGLTLPVLRDAFSSSIVGDSTVLRFTVTTEDPEQARAINEAIVESYLAVTNQPVDEEELEFVETRIVDVQDEISSLDTELAALESEEAANAARRLQIEADSDVAQARLADLEGRLVDLRASEEAPSGSENFVEGEIDQVSARLSDLVAEAQALESDDAATRSNANRLRDERTVLRSELQDFEEMKVDMELDQIAATRVAVLAAPHAVDDPVGLTPTRAIVLGLLVGGALAFAWVIAATQLRRKR